jgi:hypothetical protein
MIEPHAVDRAGRTPIGGLTGRMIARMWVGL